MKPYSKQFRECYHDGTAAIMTPRLKLKMPASDRKLFKFIFKFRKSEPKHYPYGPLFCGKKPGICSAKHCRRIDSAILAALLLFCPSIPAKPTNETLNFLKTLPNSTNYIREYNQHGPPGTNRVQRINPTPIK